MYDTDVLIVGAGPTGMTLALELSVLGIDFRIVDKAAARSDKSRALAIQPRTLEQLNRHGNAARELFQRGNPIEGVRVFVNRRLAADANLDNLGVRDTQFPTPAFISQVETENFLEKHLSEDHRVEIERGVATTRIQQDGDGVVVALQNEATGMPETVRARYVVGGDGAHSLVRHASSLKFEGAAYPQEFVLADVHIDWLLIKDLQHRLNMFMGKGMMLVFPLKGGLVRLVLCRPSRGGEGGDPDAPPTLAMFEEAMSHFCPGEARLYDPVWLARFRLHHRGVNAYRDGRLFVAGDAAHIHSPAGGQGMNTGIQDAINLSWKLAKVIRAEKAGTTSAAESEKLLDSYHEERWPVGQGLLTGTDRMFSWATWANPIFMFLRNLLAPWILPWIMSDERRRAEAFRFISEFGVNYRDSSAVGTVAGFKGPIVGGDRPSDGPIRHPDGNDGYLMDLCMAGMHHMLLFAGTGPKAATAAQLEQAKGQFLQSGNSDKATVDFIFDDGGSAGEGCEDVGGRLHKAFGFEGPGYVYVRPDNYIAHIGPLSALGQMSA